MSDIPTTKLTASLKQLSMDDCPEFLRALFEVLFPRFYDESDWSWDEHPAAKEMLQASPKVVLAQPKPARRFGGYALPRRRYYTVCADSDGNDHGTLIHELRAYRNPARSGMVEVMDHGMGTWALAIGDQTKTFERERQLGVIIHELAAHEELLRHAPHQEIEGHQGKSAALLKFPYRIEPVELTKTIDLRDPATRDWFGSHFSKPNDDWVWPERVLREAEIDELPDGPHTFRSMYERNEGQAPAPNNFIEMLPTLLNPARGGGDLSWSGMTLMAIGEWLRNRGIEALIYPASRSDAFAIYENGVLQDFGGWCLVDYRYQDSESPAHYVVLDQSPWSWVALPPGVTVQGGEEGTSHAGTLIIEGIVKQGADEYLDQLESLRVAEDAIGPPPSDMTTREAFAIGTFMLRWLHLAFASVDQEHVTTALQTACGLTLRNDQEFLANKIRWIYKRLAQDGQGQPALEGLIETASEFESRLPEGEPARAAYSAAVDLELVLLLLTRSALAGDERVGRGLSAPGIEGLELPPAVKAKADTFMNAIHNVEGEIGAASVAAVELAEALAAHFDRESRA